MPERSRGDVSFHYQAEVNEFLLQLDKAYRNGIFVVGATNHLNLVDDAVIRPGRFDKKLFIGPPDIKARIEAFKNGVRNRPHKINKWNYLGEETKYYTFAEIKYVIDEAARHVAAGGKTRIDLNDLMKVIQANPPQLTKRKLDQY